MYPDDSETMRLHFYNRGYSDKDIGRILGKKEGTIKKWRIRRELTVNIQFFTYDTPEEISECQRCLKAECTNCLERRKHKYNRQA